MSREKFVDFYALLAIAADATSDEVRRAFMQCAKKQHPDAGGSLEQMQLLNKAYATLKDLPSRRAYDRMHGFQTGTTAVQYKVDASDGDATGTDMSDEEMDDFIDTLFAEYSVKKPKESLHKKAASVIRFRKKS